MYMYMLYMHVTCMCGCYLGVDAGVVVHVLVHGGLLQLPGPLLAHQVKVRPNYQDRTARRPQLGGGGRGEGRETNA